MVAANQNSLNDLFAVTASSAVPREFGPIAMNGEGLELRELGEAVARRTRSLIAPTPILELEANKSQRGLDLSQHDLRMLCLVVLDVVIDKMGFGTGATRRDIDSALSPILETAEPGIVEADKKRAVGIILDALFNERGRRQHGGKGQYTRSAASALAGTKLAGYERHNHLKKDSLCPECG